MYDVKKLKFWCQKIIPLVYDDSMSYYEVLCKVVQKMNELIQGYTEQNEVIQELQEAVSVIQKWIDDFDTSYAEKIIEDCLATMIFVEISNGGYFVYYIPEKWEDIEFNTTGLDVDIPNTDYGRLVLSY